MDSAEEGAQEMTVELARWDLIMVYLKCACVWRYFSKGTDNMPHCRVSPRRCGHASLLIFFLSYSARISFSSASILSFPLPRSLAPLSISFPPLSSRYIWANIHFVLKREYRCLTAFVVPACCYYRSSLRVLFTRTVQHFRVNSGSFGFHF